MVGGELAVLAPVGRDDFVPLPGEDLEIVGRPRTGDPVGCGGLGRVAGAAGEIDDDGDAEFFRQQDGLAADIAVVRGAGRIGMERVAVAAERADGDAAIGEELLKFGEGFGVVEHGELAVRVAGIIAGTEFDGVDVKGLKLVENSRERQLGEERGKDSDFHA